MLVKNMMAGMMLLSLAVCANANNQLPISATGGVRQDYVDNNSIIGLGLNLFKYVSNSLSKEDQITHVKAVIYALSALDTGQEAEWSNPSNGTAGRIKIVLTRPVQGGYCRTFFTQVEKNNQVREYTEQGCKTIDSQFWIFPSR